MAFGSITVALGGCVHYSESGLALGRCRRNAEAGISLSKCRAPD